MMKVRKFKWNNFITDFSAHYVDKPNLRTKKHGTKSFLWSLFAIFVLFPPLLHVG